MLHSASATAGFYEFRQLDGKLQRVNKDQVKSIKDLE
ncbi:YgdI/YgdR family lipoprotein [Pseudomonas aeruginosa]|nr:YgdI/YgdR family lipoprotein [Pseudomonas aeruginosa]